MLVSIIITNFNYEKYIHRCIRSCLAQTLDKNLYEKGTDYLPIYNNYYAIENYDKANFNYDESIQALGLKYNVNKGFYLIFSANQVKVDDKIINLKYDFNQYLLILNINF